jgi:hypothetical protein
VAKDKNWNARPGASGARASEFFSQTEVEERWQFEAILNNHSEDGLHYLVKWKRYPATWQPGKDLKGNDEALLNYHAANPEKPGPPQWLKIPQSVSSMQFFSCFEPLETNVCLERGYCHSTNPVFLGSRAPIPG